ncbi:MAG: diguanylate cyclase [Dethiobacter sp.]|jgi:diguanylate cyclase (GGDEF)-like protein|nr:diguanylate cyclase [Dethiobacter sp.]MBS3901394.1 diguanylate cyclase [Dethiobacter sp.]MBS3988672.1 diguanylate cyclase [Dethiobacter sp.]
MKEKRLKKDNALTSVRWQPVHSQLPYGFWQIIVIMYLIPPLVDRQTMFPGDNLLARMGIYAFWILPLALLCYHLGMRGGLVAALGVAPFFFWHLRGAMQLQAEYFSVLAAYFSLFLLFAVAAGTVAGKLKRQADSFWRDAVTDELSGLFNHRFFHHCLEKEVDRVRRYQFSLALVIIDLDNFKQYNDKWGHPQGDKALACAARILQDTVRASDTVARCGGEEFAIILPQTTLTQAKQLCERIREVMESTPIPLQKGEKTEPLTASFGVAVYEQDMTALQLVEEADRILYFAKRSGKNLVTCK